MRKFTAVITYLGFLLLPSLAFAQATITGVVRDASGAVLPGVTVEAASDALIEKVRIAVSDGTGQFRIIDLRPGTYAVTFTLTGFQTTRREGIELEGQLTATVNADMRVGALEETITVTGETPIVDVQSVRRQTTISGDVINAIPSARAYGAIMQLIPSLTVQASFTPGARDVQVTPSMSVFGGAGRPRERRPPAGGRHQHRRAGQRRRRLELHRRPDQLAGSRVHDVGRHGRGRGRRPGDERRAEGRWQHRQGHDLCRVRGGRHGRQQLHRRAEGRGVERARASC